MGLNFGPGFADAYLKQDNIEKEQKIKSQELDLKAQDLGVRKAAAQAQTEQWRGEQIRKNAELMIKNMEPFAKTITELADRGVVVGPDHPIAQALMETTKSAASYLKLLPGMDEATANKFALSGYNLAMSGTYRPEETKVITPGGVAVGIGSNHPKVGVAVLPTEKRVDVPGEYGSTTVVESQGGGAPQVVDYKTGAVTAAPTMPKAPAVPGQPAGVAPPGVGGKPPPPEIQQTISHGMNALRLLNSMEDNLGATGIVKGPISSALEIVGLSKEGSQFKRAREQYLLAAQSIIKGVPSNMDVKQLESTLARLWDSEGNNKDKIDLARMLTKSLVEDTIDYYKFTGVNIPEGVRKEAKKLGIDMERGTSYDDPIRVRSATSRAEDLLGRIDSGEIKNAADAKKATLGISGMNADEIRALDPKKLKPSELQQLMQRMRELQNG